MTTMQVEPYEFTFNYTGLLCDRQRFHAKLFSGNHGIYDFQLEAAC